MPSTLPGKPGTLAPAPALGGTVEHRTRLFDRRRSTPGAARKFIEEALTSWGRTERFDDVQLCTSELVTNAILHGASAGGRVLVRVTLDDIQVRIEVHDSGDATPRRRHVADTADSGRGLLLVSAVAEDWGVEERQGPGKCVWAAFHHSVAPGC
ncbi:ATP-binding protein [Streptomyces sp. HUAS TT20]|uniref:ATP-binding protein n=1 Tax=Streptomyces sp. HUAS TT20 TaxID=3447509 RepID=UPI0021DA16BD|nr:ATP-binding protein [Streptomyces sp. HUAS 15-9]UXY33051.1 ATP-binding protein [Streptomyces sp. HUAS 15-9]